MKHLVSISVALCSFAIISCTNKLEEYKLKIKVIQLTEATMYDRDVVVDVLFDAEEQNIDTIKTKATKIFLSALDEYKNRKNVPKAVSKFKESILVFPTPKAYFELGNALTDMGGKANLEEAIQSYDVALELNFNPKSTIYYNEARVAYTLSNIIKVDDETYSNWDVDRAVGLLGLAFKEGFYDTVMLKKDARLKNIIYTNEFKSMYLDMEVKKITVNANNIYSFFKKSFPLVEQTFIISADNVDMKDFSQSITYEFAPFIPEMENTSFGREVSHDYFYVAKVNENSNYTAIIYKSVSFYGGEMQPTMAYLATYDNDGDIISKMVFACQCSAEKIKSGKIENSTIYTEDYKRIWEKPIDEVRFEENAVKSRELLSKSEYYIDETGKITPKGGNAADSLITLNNNKNILID